MAAHTPLSGSAAALLALGAAASGAAPAMAQMRPAPSPNEQSGQMPSPFPGVDDTHAPKSTRDDHAKKALDAAGEQSLHDMAACMAKRHPADVVSMLATDPASIESTKRILHMFYEQEGCRNQTFEQFKVARDVMRGALAEQLYLRTYATPPSGPGTAAGSRVSPAGNPVTVRYAVAACAAGRDPEAADALVRAARRSPEEQAAARRLAPALNACAAGHVDFNGGQLHAALAEALFKMRGAAVQGGHHAQA